MILDEFIVRKFKPEDACQVSRLITTTFNAQVGRKLPSGVKKVFSEVNTSDKILELSKRGEVFVADKGGKIIGIIAGIDNNRVIRLFVYKKFQGQGIAKKLMRRLESLYKKRAAKSIHVRSSLYAVDFYNVMGYKKVTRVIHNKDGMAYQPMIKYLS